MSETNERLRKARERAGFKSARSAAIRFGWVPSTYASHENGQSDVPRKAAETYARAFKVSAGWILTGEGEPVNHPAEKLTTPGTIAGESNYSVASDAASIPEIDVRAGGGYGGGFSQEENVVVKGGITLSRDAVRARWGIPLPFLREELRARPDRVHIVPVRGDSMTDALFDGDRAIIDLDDTDISQGGIFALVDDLGSVIVKQVEVIRGGDPDHRRIRCSSRNKNYDPFELELGNPARIIGRVAAKITRL